MAGKLEGKVAFVTGAARGGLGYTASKHGVVGRVYEQEVRTPWRDA